MSDYISQNRCTVQRRKGDFCDAESAEDMPFPICSHHGIQLFVRMKEILDTAAPKDPEPPAPKAKRGPAKKAAK